MSTEVDKKQAIAKRGFIKSKLTRFKSFLDKYTIDVNTTEFKLRLAGFKPCLSEFNEIQEKLYLIDPDNAESSLEIEEFESHYYSLYAKAEEILTSLNVDKDTPRTQANSEISQNIPSNASETASIPVRLPTISLPSFSGKYEQWMSFYDSFTSLIDKNESLSDIQKLQYLKSSLRDQAAETIQNIDLTAANYSIAMELLKKQFHNNRIIIQNHIKSLFNFPNTQNDKPSTYRTLVNTIYTHLRALDSLSVQTENWDPMLIHLITSRLDATTHREWELTTQPDKFPMLTELTDFLQKRSQTLEAVKNNREFESNQSSTQSRFNQNHHQKFKTHLSVQDTRCPFCMGNHQIYFCAEFRQLPERERFGKLTKAKVCTNCLRSNHLVQQCKSPTGCKHCGERHHSILHSAPQTIQNTTQTSQPCSSNDSQKQSKVTLNSTISHAVSGNGEVLLSTAVVDIMGPEGNRITCRAFLDNGSQSCFMTEDLCQKLKLKREKISTTVTGISGETTQITHKVRASVHSKTTNYTIDSAFYVLKQITGQFPTNHINTRSLNIPPCITLADPFFSEPGRIDILIGQEHFLDILDSGKIKATDSVIFQNTKFGWIAGGHTNPAVEINRSKCHLSVLERLDDQQKDSWKVEEPMLPKPLLSEEGRDCEELFIETASRRDGGKCTDHLPAERYSDHVGDSKQTKIKRFHQLEIKLKQDQEFHSQDDKFMRKYEELGEMELVADHNNTIHEYYPPNHVVLEESSATSKALDIMSDHQVDEVRYTYQPDQKQNMQLYPKHTASTQKISWQFITCISPHFGKSWEAGVKSVKNHLRKTLGTANLTFEKPNTTLTMVEACPNSCPLNFLSADPNDPRPLTPGHFLIGETLTSLPDADLTSLSTHHLPRWQRTQQIWCPQHFWSHWSKEYLSQLQQRQRRTDSGRPPQQPASSQVLLMGEDKLPPLKWVTAVVESVHPGADGRTRVATVKTPCGLFKRAINRLCPLPIDN